VRVSFTSGDPEKAATMVNTLFSRFIAFNLDLRTESTRRASEFITRQMNTLQNNLAQKEEELQKYSKSKDLFYLTNEESAEVGKFSDLSRAHTDAQIDRINKESVYRELKRKKFEEFSGVRNNTLINSLKGNYSTLEADYNRKSQVFKDSYPEMNQIRSQMESLNRRIEEETKNIAEKALKEAKTNYDSAMKKEKYMLELLDGQKKEMAVSNSNAIYHKSLSIEVDNMRNLQNYLDRKHKESMLSSNLDGLQISNIKVIDPADIPRNRIAPKRKTILIMALVLGFAGGLMLIFFLDFMDRSVKGPDDVKALLGVPTLGVIPSSAAKTTYYSYLQYLPYKRGKTGANEIKEIEMINFLDPESPMSESYRNIRTSILLSTAGKPPKIITVSSARPSEGKTATAINLAIAFNQLGKKVLLIDADLRKPRVHKIFRLKNTVGLSSYLVGRAPWTKIVNKTKIPNLSVITSGPTPPNPVELLDSEVMSSLLNKMAEPKFDFIFIDSPPFIDIMDAVLLGKLSDGMVMVSWSGKTNRNVLQKAGEQIQQFDIRLLGVVLNKVNLKGEGVGYNYSYQYGREEQEEVAKGNLKND
ncbi:MAG: polysaccharide biosynthesis tyrosine autokinase, partial [bacterium]|nr:polysaccharide biosynthesis tyrosine autokinase [bacterium]